MSSLDLHPLTYLREGDEVTVGRMDTGSFAVLPADGAALLDRLGRGASLDEAARWYETEYGEPVDMDDFIEAIRDLGFVREAGDAAAAPVRVRWQRLGRALFSRVSAACCIVLVLAAAVVMVRSPDLVPTTSHAVFSSYVALVAITLFVAQFPFILLHEAAHALAGRRLGLPSRLSLGRRLYFLVVETTMDGLVAVPRRKRYLPVLAGMICDCVTIAVLTLAAAATDGVPRRALVAIAFTSLMRMAWQLQFYLRTDVYHLVVTVLGCVDLHATSKAVLRRRLRRAEVDLTAFHPTDLRAARWYSWFMLGGYVYSLGLLAFVTVPLSWRFCVQAYDSLTSSSVGEIADSAVFLIITVGQFAVLGVLALRDRARRA